MAIVYCENTDCKYYDTQSFNCTKDAVTIVYGSEYGCDDFEDYRKAEEYGEKYYIAVMVDGVKAKAVQYGKKIEYNGRVFFTQDRVTYAETYTLTDKRTGYMVGAFVKLKLKDKWEKFLSAEKELPDVETYPLAVKQNDGKYKLVEEGGENNEGK